MNPSDENTKYSKVFGKLPINMDPKVKDDEQKLECLMGIGE